MRFEVFHTSDFGFRGGESEEVEIETLEDLKALWEREAENSLIIDFLGPTIEVYNGYREG